jgi:hypothetical protein
MAALIALQPLRSETVMRANAAMRAGNFNMIMTILSGVCELQLTGALILVAGRCELV